MSDRVVHVITSECEVYVENLGDMTRVRITEKNSKQELLNPTSFEIEGSAQHISEALATAASVLANIEEQSRKDPN